MRTVLGFSAAGLVLCVLLGAFLGVSGFTFVYAEGASYLSNDPRACVNCHVMRDHYQGWQGASHHTRATCNDCHVPVDFAGKYWTKVEHGFRHSKGFTFDDFHEPIQIKESSRRVVLNNCVRCHETATAEITSHWGGRKITETTNDCIRCHAAVGHGP